MVQKVQEIFSEGFIRGGGHVLRFFFRGDFLGNLVRFSIRVIVRVPLGEGQG